MGQKGIEIGTECGACLNNKYVFDSARSVYLYKGSLREILQMYKYSYLYYLGEVFAGLIYEKLKDYFENIDMLIPVPLHINRIRRRGYNQSAILCREISRKTGLQSGLFILRKVRDTKPQVELRSFDERAENVKDAYVLNQDIVGGKDVMLIDDVFTSGSTVQECSRVLMKGGATTVKVLTIARSVYH